MLTDDTIAAAMERAISRLRADRSRPQRLTLMPNAVDHVLIHVGADGWVEIGVIVDPELSLGTLHGRLWGVSLLCSSHPPSTLRTLADRGKATRLV